MAFMGPRNSLAAASYQPRPQVAPSGGRHVMSENDPMPGGDLPGPQSGGNFGPPAAAGGQTQPGRSNTQGYGAAPEGPPSGGWMGDSLARAQYEADAPRKAAEAEAAAQANANQAAATGHAPGQYYDPQTRSWKQQWTDPHSTAESMLDPNSPLSNSLYWGGSQGAAQADVDRYRGMGDQYANRGLMQANFGNADQSRGLGLQSRGSQADAMQMYRNAALGNGPTAAGSQFQSGLDQSIAAQQAMAGSARGGATAMAAAQMRGQQAAGAQLAQSTAQAASLRAQEQQAAMAGYGNLGTVMRAGDLGLQGQDANQALGQGELGLKSQALNDQNRLAAEQMAFSTRAQQVAAAQEKQRAFNAQQGIAIGQYAGGNATRQLNQNNDAATIGAIGGGVAGAAAIAGQIPWDSLFPSDKKFKEKVAPGDREVAETLDALEAKSYRYKEGVGQPTERRLGILAQDLEKSHRGRAAVVNKPDGKYVEAGAGMSIALASVANLHKRLKKLEGGK